MYYLSQRSLSRLEGVHPDLVKVIKLAITLTPYDFGVTEGLRTVATQVQYVKDGKSTTLDSYHLKQADGFSHAVDLYVLIDGESTTEHKYFRKVIQALVTAAIQLGVQVEFGGLWRDFLDSPHIQLNDEYYHRKSGELYQYAA